MTIAEFQAFIRRKYYATDSAQGWFLPFVGWGFSGFEGWRAKGYPVRTGSEP